MIPFDFIYCRPDSVNEATDAYYQLQNERKTAVYYAGGSEIITMCRADSIRPNAVIDIKSIPECRVLEFDGQTLHIGAACTLNQIKQSRLFPLLGLACGRIADHTNQCRITLGGNLCGTIIYRETSLPLMLSDTDITLIGPEGQRTLPFKSVFSGRMQLEPGELIVQVHVPEWALYARFAHIKRTTNEKIDYPLINVTAIWKDDLLRIAFTGICSFPFRSEKIETVLNDHKISRDERVGKAVKMLPEPAHYDTEGSDKYRGFCIEKHSPPPPPPPLPRIA